MKFTERVKRAMLCLNENAEPQILHDDENECTHYNCGCSVTENDNNQVTYYICMSHAQEEKLMKNFTPQDYESFFGKPLVQAAIITVLILLIFFSRNS